MKGGMKNKLSKEHYQAGNLLAFIAWFQVSSGYFERTGICLNGVYQSAAEVVVNIHREHSLEESPG